MTRSSTILFALMLLGARAFAAPPEIEAFDDAFSAVRGIVDGRAVIAVGEFHETTGGAKATSALAHFRDELLGPLLPKMSDLVVETWVTTGRCGKAEAETMAKVEESTQRPATTESEIIGVLRRAKEGGAKPHVLEIDCHDYQSLTGADGKVDYVRLLGLVTEGLIKQTLAALAKRDPAARDKAVFVYGGALHNDVFPRQELAAYSFAKRLSAQTRGRYLELDLYVPEYVEADAYLVAQPWYARYQQKLVPGKFMRVRRSASSYILLFPRASAKAAEAR